MIIECPKCHTDNPEDSKYCKECATPFPGTDGISISQTRTLQTPSGHLTRGTRFADRYEIIEKLGEGGMGAVYRVDDTKVHEEVALKIVSPLVTADKKIIERFRNELKFARKIRHKHVCQMFDLGEDEGTLFITMEYVAGEDLKSLLRRTGKLTIEMAVRVAKQVCEGLAGAHSLGIVHRDLKPSNIMIDKEGQARIMDFGIARSIKAKGITGAGLVIGTPEYMAPEQAEGKEADSRSDIYSLGVILFEMLTGQRPFEGDSALGVAMKHKGEMPKNPKELNSQIPDDLSSVILKCLGKESGNRYQSTAEVRSELEKIEQGLPTTERAEPKTKPLTSKEVTVQFRIKKVFIPAFAIIAVAVIGLMIWNPWSKKEAVSIAPTGKPSLAVMYFKNNTGDEDFEIWRTALSDSLITDLSQSKFIRVLSAADLYSILRGLNLHEAKTYASEDLKKVAIEGRVNFIIQGGLSKAGDTFRIDYTLHEMNTDEAISSDRVEGAGEESIFTMVDALTMKIKASLELSVEQIASDIDKEVGKITTSSPEAYKYYVEGLKYHEQQNYDQSIVLMKRAVALDPEFVLAYRRMSIGYLNLGNRAESIRHLKRAFELRDRVSERERYIIEGDLYRMSVKTYDRAIEAYYKILDIYPDDQDGNNMLGIMFRSIEEWDKAIERYEVLIHAKEKTMWPYQGIARIYMSKGMYEKAREILEYFLDNFYDNAVIHHRLVIVYICQGKYDLALSEVDKASHLDPTLSTNFMLKGDIFQIKGEFSKAEKEYQKLVDRGWSWGHNGLAYLYLVQGRLKKAVEEALSPRSLVYMHLASGNYDMALEECEKWWSITVDGDDWPQRWILFLKGLIFLKMGSLDETKRIARELKELVDKGMIKKEIRYYHHLMGMVELETKNYSCAIESFKIAISLLSSQSREEFAHALFFDPLALAYYESGVLDKAREEYKRITSLTKGRQYYGDIYAKSFYMLGKIYEQQDNRNKAIEHYEKFLSLWKDADPVMVEVDDAKKRLAGLKR